MIYYVYILASASRVLYIGVTNNLMKRIFEHKTKLVEGFTQRYNVNRLVYFEECGDILNAIEYEKKLKGWTRAKKIALIESVNRDWKDLSESWEHGEILRSPQRPQDDNLENPLPVGEGTATMSGGG